MPTISNAIYCAANVLEGSGILGFVIALRAGVIPGMNTGTSQGVATARMPIGRLIGATGSTGELGLQPVKLFLIGRKEQSVGPSHFTNRSRHDLFF